MNLFTLLAFIVFVGTIPVLIFTGIETNQQFERSIRMKTTEGRIVSSRIVYVEGRYDDHFDRYIPGYYVTRFLIRFVNDKGNLSEFESNLPEEVGDRKIGDEVEVIYDSLSIDVDAQIYISILSRWQYVIFMMLLNAVIILAPVVLFGIGKYVSKRNHFQQKL
jgi:hypothetical protein